VVLDLGSGALANLLGVLAARRDPPVDDLGADASLLDEVDAVVVSHEHPDHWTDLTGLRVALRYGSGRSGLPVYLTAGTRALAAAVCSELEPPFDLHVIDDGDAVTVGGLTLRFSATDHYVPTLACRVGDGTHAVAYTADTGPYWSLRHFGEHVDLALVECSHLADRETEGILHLSARQAGTMAAEGGVGALLLTHLVPGLDRAEALAEARAEFAGPVGLAEEGRTYVVGDPSD
jgi:ribonuclease BN (tRNA processing enzyme)